MLHKALISSDIYGYPVCLNMHRKTEYKTAVGGFLSLTTIIIAVILIQKGVVDLFSRSQFQVFQLEINISYQITQHLHADLIPPNKTIRTEQFVFAIGFNLPWNYEKDLFTISVVQMHRRQKEQVEVINKIKMSKCKIENFQLVNGHSFAKQFQLLNLETYYCPERNQSLSFGGLYQSNDFDFVRISIELCKDSSECHSLKEIQEMMKIHNLDYLQLSMTFTNFQLNSQDPNAIEAFLSSDNSVAIVPGVSLTKTNVLLKQNNFIEDKSIFPFQIDMQEVVFFNVNNEDISTQTISTQNPNVFAEIQLGLHQQKITINKSYEKFDELIAYAGGILKALVFILGIIIGNYNKQQWFGYYVSLANQLYTFNVPPPKESSYVTQDLSEESELCSLDLLKKRIQERVQKVKLAVEKFQRGTSKIKHLQRVSHLIGASPPLLNQMREETPLFQQQLNEIRPLNQSSPNLEKKNIVLDHPQEAYVIQPISQKKDHSHPNHNHHQAQNKYQSPQTNQTAHNKIVFQQVKQNQEFKSDSEEENKNGQQHINGSERSIKAKRVRFDYPNSKELIKEEPNEDWDNSDKVKDLNSGKGQTNDTQTRIEFLTSSFQDILAYHQKIKLVFMYFFGELFCKKYFLKNNIDIQLLDKAIKMVKKDTDIVTILDKLQDIDKLKRLFLNEDQALLFSYTPKPIVRVKQKKGVLQSYSHQDGRPLDIDDHEQIAGYMETIKSQQLSLLSQNSKYDTLESLFKLYRAYDHLFHQSNNQAIHQQESHHQQNHLASHQQSHHALNSDNHLQNNNHKDHNEKKSVEELNSKLIILLGEDLRDIFEISYCLKDDSPMLGKRQGEQISQPNQLTGRKSEGDQQKGIVSPHDDRLSSLLEQQSIARGDIYNTPQEYNQDDKQKIKYQSTKSSGMKFDNKAGA